MATAVSFPRTLPPAHAADFLARAGWGGAEIVPLADDASFRRYFRVSAEGRQAVLMDAPPPHEDPRPFVKVARYLTALGFAAPAILADGSGEGLVLLEDFGDARLRETLDAEPAREAVLYRDAVALLAALHRHAPAEVPPYSRAELEREVALFVEWYCPAAALDVDCNEFVAAWQSALAHVEVAAPVTVLRDYHAENIMIRRERSGTAALGLLDFQDALVGHAAYDLVSLLQDARRDVDPAVEAAMIDHYRTLSGPDGRFEASYAVLGAQRNTKILGIFARLWRRDGKPRYRALMPRVWRYLERDLAHPALADVRDWFDRSVPQAKRGDYLAALPE